MVAQPARGREKRSAGSGNGALSGLDRYGAVFGGVHPAESAAGAGTLQRAVDERGVHDCGNSAAALGRKARCSNSTCGPEARLTAYPSSTALLNARIGR